MAFTLDAKALFKELGTGHNPGGLEGTLTTQRIVEILTQRGLKVLGVYGRRANIKAENGRLYLPVNGRVVEIEIPIQRNVSDAPPASKPIGGKWYKPYAERIAEPFIDY